jgi:hypothetical protein
MLPSTILGDCVEKLFFMKYSLYWNGFLLHLPGQIINFAMTREVQECLGKSMLPPADPMRTKRPLIPTAIHAVTF